MTKKLGDVIGVTVQKGGVGKSTFSQAIAYSYANKGYKTALIDLDPQATLSGAFFGYSYGAFTYTEENGILKYDVSNIDLSFIKLDFEPVIWEVIGGGRCFPMPTEALYVPDNYSELTDLINKFEK